MSAERSPAVEEQKRKGLRVAFAVSIGFTFAVYAGAIVPFLGPLFAAQFLLGSSRPMPTFSIWRQSHSPFSVAAHGVPLTMRTTPRRSSSCFTRCEMAEGVTFKAVAALSKLPVWTMVATARRAG